MELTRITLENSKTRTRVRFSIEWYWGLLNLRYYRVAYQYLLEYALCEYLFNSPQLLTFFLIGQLKLSHFILF